MKITYETSKKQSYLSELKSLTDNNPEKPEIAYWYSTGLLIMIDDVNDEERDKYQNELQRLFNTYPNDARIVASFCDGLVYMITVTTELKKKQEILSQIECLAHDAGCDDLTVEGLKHQFNARYVINGQIYFSYCKGLLILLHATPDMNEKKKYLSIIKRLVDVNPWFPDFAGLYSHGLLLMINATSDMEEKKQYLKSLKHLLREDSGDLVPFLDYCKATLIMSQLDEKGHDYYMSELSRVLSNEKISKFIATNDQNFFYSIRRELLDYELNHPLTIR